MAKQENKKESIVVKKDSKKPTATSKTNSTSKSNTTKPSTAKTAPKKKVV
jgi:hypothetical protein